MYGKPPLSVGNYEKAQISGNADEISMSISDQKAFND